MLPLFTAFFHPILFILAGNDDMHESLEGFKIRPDSTTDGRKNLHRLILGKFGVARVSCPSGSKKIMFPLFLFCYLSDPL